MSEELDQVLDASGFDECSLAEYLGLGDEQFTAVMEGALRARAEGRTTGVQDWILMLVDEKGRRMEVNP
jgi:hypothetical protein